MPRATSGYSMSAEALALAHAVQAWKAKSGKGFPTWSEIVGVLLDLGWVPPSPHPCPPSPPSPPAS